MNMTVLMNIVNPIQSDDWLLVILIVIFLLSCLVFVPRRESFSRLVGFLYKFKNPDAEVNYPQSSPAGFILQTFLSCASVALMFTCVNLNEVNTTAELLMSLLYFLGCIAVVLILKLVLYQIVNGRLYRKQSTSLKPTRWNGFFVSAFSLVGNLALILCVITIFFSVPPIIVISLFAIIIILLEIGLISKIKTAIFRNKCSILIFFLYLCALEIGPVVLMTVLLHNLLS